MNEKTLGKEKLKLAIDRMAPPTSAADIGDPVVGSTTYAACLYDENDVLRSTVRVDRAGAQCGTKPCWKVTSGPGVKYSDKLLEADGVQQIVAKAGIAGKGKMIVKGKNDLPHGRIELPTGVAPPMTGHRHATVQVFTSDAGCFSGVATRVRKADGLQFKANAP